MHVNSLFFLAYFISKLNFCKSISLESNVEQRACIKPSEVSQKAIQFETQTALSCARLCKKVNCPAFLLADIKNGGKTCAIIPEDQVQPPGAGCGDSYASVDVWTATHIIQKCAGVNRPKYEFKESRLSNLNIPYTTAIPGGLCEGRSLTIVGTPQYTAGDADLVFHVYLQCDPTRTLRCNALTFAVWLKQDYEAHRITTLGWYSSAGWEDGGSKANDFPFNLDEQYEIKIMITATDFLIGVNGKAHMSLSHQIKPIEIITHIKITGSTEVSSLRFD